MAQIVFFETEEWEEKYFKNLLPTEDIVFHPHSIIDHPETDQSIYDAEIISVFIYSQLTSNVLLKFKNLKFITTRSTGFDHIDLNYCKEKGITVSNVPSYGVHSVAEHAFMLMLAIAKKLIVSVDQARKGDFSSVGLTGFELFEKTLGIIGAGKIGKKVCQIALGFGMKVLIYSHHTDLEIERIGAQFVDLNQLLSNSDIVSIHVPLTFETKYLINLDNIKTFKKGSILINTSRGAIVETQAILEGLNSGILSGVGLDVLEGECELKEEREFFSSQFLKTCDIKTQLMDHILLSRNDVVITPHNAFNTKESLEIILATTIDNINAFKKETPLNVI